LPFFRMWEKYNIVSKWCPYISELAWKVWWACNGSRVSYMQLVSDCTPWKSCDAPFSKFLCWGRS